MTIVSFLFTLFFSLYNQVNDTCILLIQEYKLLGEENDKMMKIRSKYHSLLFCNMSIYNPQLSNSCTRYFSP